ncbi:MULTISPECIES: HNH endonuclease signature motif containing protein [unclassified Rathayibacter]|uniref:HNH endonuclease signature motif containing protein n=1 Tax=unclassified Rathayibacter TaxID=2609250 RepID=UPI00138F4F1A|nr:MULTISPECIES: HNH endonuclease signature motif containing protein [unclassified Rathayibacter]
MTPDTVRALTDIAAGADVTSSLAQLTKATAVYAAYRAARLIPEAFVRGGSLSRSDSRDLFERSIRAELAVSMRTTERRLARLLQHGRLLIEDLPRTRAALADGAILWEASQVVCDAAATLPQESRAALDERAAELALTATPTQLQRAVARMRDQLHDEPLAARHVRARADRGVWVTPEIDGMATLGALLPAAAAMGALNRIDRIARNLRDGRDDDSTADSAGDERTLAQLRADALVDLLCDGDIAGTTPVGDGPTAPPTFVPGARAEVRLTLAASTATGADDAPAALDGYVLIPAGTARELVGVGASFTRILTDPETGAVASVGLTHRVPRPRMRLHLQLRDQTCRFPGCTRPASTGEADHTIEWRNGGETSLDNLASLCTGHHHVRHGDRWTYVLHPDGTADWSTPTGRLLTTRPPGLPGRPPDPRPRSENGPPPF